MKNIFLFMLLCGLCYGCTTEESLPTEEINQQEECIVALKMGGEILSEDIPLATKAETASRDLYGVQVYKGDSYFAYGLFDNVNDMQLALLKGSTYKFVCTLVKNGRDLLNIYDSRYYNSIYNYYNYNAPFVLSRDTITTKNNQPAENIFIYSTSRYFNSLGLGTSMLKDRTYTDQCPQLDRYYGELSYTPTSNGSVTLEMKRTAFGVKCVVPDIPDGSVSVHLFNSSGISYYISRVGSSESEGALITFNDVKGAWERAANYTENVTVSVVWTRGIGITQYLGTKDITVKRNTMNVIRLSLSASDGDASFGITTENTAMGEDAVDIPLH
jgi:hypothetical protein